MNMVRAFEKMAVVLLFAALAGGCATTQIPLPDQIGVSDKPMGGGGKNPEVPETCPPAATASR